MTVRAATLADIPQAADGAARAFRHDPLMSWILPDDATRLDRCRRFFAAGFGQMVRRRTRDVLVPDDPVAIATWAPPGKTKVPKLAMLPVTFRILAAVGVGGMRRSATVMSTLAAAHPEEPHWYLEGIGVHPDHQGRGIGRALIQARLDVCDRDGLPAYLETQNPENVPYYASMGFQVVGELDIPDGGPHMQLMWRP